MEPVVFDNVRLDEMLPRIASFSELFSLNRDALLPVLTRYIGRLEDFRAALEAGDTERLHRALEQGVKAKGKLC